MGIGRGMIKLLMREGNRESFFGNILTIGKQNISPTSIKDLHRFARDMNFKIRLLPDDISVGKKAPKDNYIGDRILLLSLGFDIIDSMDFSNFEQCTIVHDLNKDVPISLHNKYDLIFDGGSTEHIFNVPKVLENYNKMLKVGGRIVHSLPSNGFVDHGFYMFSPTLFWDYYSANKWEIKDALFFRHPREVNAGLWDIYQYTPHCLDVCYYLSQNKSRYGTFFVAKKNSNTIYDASVQQGFYTETWKGRAITGSNAFDKVKALNEKIWSILPVKLKIALRPLYLYFFSKIPLRCFLKMVARY